MRAFIRKLLTNPWSILILGIGFFIMASVGSILPGDFFIGQIIRAVGNLGFLIGIHLIVVLILWTARSIYADQISGVPKDLDNTQKAILAVGAHISSAILILSAIILASP